MNKSGKNQIRAGGEVARNIYYSFLIRPEWVNRIQPEDIEEMIGVLQEVFEMYCGIHGNLSAEYRKAGPDDEKSLDRLRQSQNVVRKTAGAWRLLEALRGIQLTTEREAENARHESRAQAFSVYCRDN